MDSNEVKGGNQKPEKSSPCDKRLRVQITEEDLLCVNGCGFYGTPQWKGRCSKCWRTYQMQEKKTQDYAKNRELLNFEKFEGRRKLSIETRSLTLKSILRKSPSMTANTSPSQESVYTAVPSQPTLSSPITPSRQRYLSEESRCAHNHFHEFLRANIPQIAAVEISRQTRHAVDKILEQQNVNMDDLSGMVQHFYQVLADKMRYSPIINDPVVRVTVDEVMAEVEQYICVRAYKKLFCARADEEIADLSLQDRIRSLNWVTAGFLETTLDFSQQSVRDKLDEAITEIIDLNSHRGAAEKLQCLIRCSNMIFEALKESRSGAPASADEYLPVLIYAILKGNPPLIQSNVKFISRFALPVRVMSGESGYYFTNLSCALQFVQNMNAESLKMPREEFEAYTSGHQVPPLNTIKSGCNQSIHVMENSQIQIHQLHRKQEDLTKHIDELELRVRRKTDDLSAEIDEILNSCPSEELKRLTEQITVEETELCATRLVPSSIQTNNSSRIFRDHELDDDEKDATLSQLLPDQGKSTGSRVERDDDENVADEYESLPTTNN